MFKKAMMGACALALIAALFTVSTVQAAGVSVTGLWNSLAPAVGFGTYPGPSNATFANMYRGVGNVNSALDVVFGLMAVVIEPIAGDDTFAVVIEPIAGDDTFNLTIEWLDQQF
jgi:hypothetical protein